MAPRLWYDIYIYTYDLVEEKYRFFIDYNEAGTSEH